MIENLLTLGKNNVVLIAFLACSGLLFAVITEQIQILAKYYGALKDKIAGGYNNAMKILVMNRFGAVSYFMCVSFAIDAGIPAESLNIFFVRTIFTVAIFNFGLFVFFYYKHYKVHPIEVRQSLIKEKKQSELFIIICVLIANSMSLLGLTLPMILSANFPDYRLTLANTGFFFNTFFTVINVFIIENYLAHIIDQKTDEIHRVISKILMARVVATLLTAFLLIKVL